MQLRYDITYGKLLKLTNLARYLDPARKSPNTAGIRFSATYNLRGISLLITNDRSRDVT